MIVFLLFVSSDRLLFVTIGLNKGRPALSLGSILEKAAASRYTSSSFSTSSPPSISLSISILDCFVQKRKNERKEGRKGGRKDDSVKLEGEDEQRRKN